MGREGVKIAKKRLDDLRALSKHRLKAWIKAVRFLRTYYLVNDACKPCPLCAVKPGCHDDIKGMKPIDMCVWQIFTGLICEDYAEKKGFYDIPLLGDFYHPEWRAMRLRQLRYGEEALIFVLEEKE